MATFYLLCYCVEAAKQREISSISWKKETIFQRRRTWNVHNDFYAPIVIIFASKSSKEHGKRRYRPAFGVHSTQTLVKIYNKDKIPSLYKICPWCVHVKLNCSVLLYSLQQMAFTKQNWGERERETHTHTNTHTHTLNDREREREEEEKKFAN